MGARAAEAGAGTEGVGGGWDAGGRQRQAGGPGSDVRARVPQSRGPAAAAPSAGKRPFGRRRPSREAAPHPRYHVTPQISREHEDKTSSSRLAPASHVTHRHVTTDT